MQSVIVYRNPMEAAFWESMSGGAIFPIFVGVIAFFAVFLIAHKFIVEKYVGWRLRGVATNINLLVSALVGLLVIAKLWI